MHKRALRKEILARRDRLSASEIAAWSKAIARRLLELPPYREAGTIMFFLSFGSEVDTGEMIEESLARGKRVLVPKTVPEERRLIPSELLDCAKDLAPGAYGIREPRPEALRPVAPCQIDLLIVPGVAFDLKGNRLGYGGGYYDRFFNRLRPGVPLVALAFELQLVEHVPVEPWDRRVDWLLTEKRAVHTAG
ncbi:MAG: 5-formyltetrahydrofolate cyclo-ligase [Firmicutes bacterium]|jgi:5-formyltetrahydrofolate cyclo-ligase|nr:5-formyltetrahydrofolate cyclo-ligase [Bacillota bacterium]HPU01831.1 5-formyltetrahydrofolate cyclo-ligase [Bacillota bacterium]